MGSGYGLEAVSKGFKPKMKRLIDTCDNLPPLGARRKLAVKKIAKAAEKVRKALAKEGRLEYGKD